jgi:hypothetical protein
VRLTAVTAKLHLVQERKEMPIAGTTFCEDAHLSYATSQVAPQAQEEHDEDGLEDFPFVGSVLPLTSSVIAPGLSMPVPAS